MRTYIPNTLRPLVTERAGHRCEYCRIFDLDSYFAFHIDHIEKNENYLLKLQWRTTKKV